MDEPLVQPTDHFHKGLPTLQWIVTIKRGWYPLYFICKCTAYQLRLDIAVSEAFGNNWKIIRSSNHLNTALISSGSFPSSLSRPPPPGGPPSGGPPPNGAWELLFGELWGTITVFKLYVSFTFGCIVINWSPLNYRVIGTKRFRVLITNEFPIIGCKRNALNCSKGAIDIEQSSVD
ncbi:hypothetical protein L218DRAFT_951808 [Marasmius fiardii PR-910]|nr:hypothetical protein L218DRAFT_951808 [Marasmius fiardii PR-910]